MRQSAACGGLLSFAKLNLRFKKSTNNKSEEITAALLAAEEEEAEPASETAPPCGVRETDQFCESQRSF